MDFLQSNMPTILKATSLVCGLLSGVKVPVASIVQAGLKMLSSSVEGNVVESSSSSASASTFTAASASTFAAASASASATASSSTSASAVAALLSSQMQAMHMQETTELKGKVGELSDSIKSSFTKL
jgi:hypothetical protein